MAYAMKRAGKGCFITPRSEDRLTAANFRELDAHGGMNLRADHLERRNEIVKRLWLQLPSTRRMGQG